MKKATNKRTLAAKAAGRPAAAKSIASAKAVASRGASTKRAQASNRPGNRPGKKGATARPTGWTDKQLEANLRSAINGVTSAVMMVDRDFVVRYVNQTTMAMLTQHEAAFRKIWPNFEPQKIVGSCIDMFHRNPAHQRQLLADPSRLPYRTKIAVGPLWFSLCVTGVFDDQRNYLGNTLEWADITASADHKIQLDAISQYQAVIEFKLDGTIVNANDNLLAATGYTLGEIQGKHHSMFVDPELRSSAEYRGLWEKLGRGEGEGGQYKRRRKDGSELWLQASYNPIPDLSGKPCKVIKYATDITAAKTLEQETVRVVAETGRVMQALAKGDLRESMTGEYTGEFAKLRDAVNTCGANLRDLVGQIRTAASSIGLSATEISQGNNDLSRRTEQQAASIEETASSMEELTGTVKQNADNARQANQLAASAREQAEKGGAVVGTAVSAMGAINEASKKIADIIGVIDEIAFQTNLLALNAAVEAARAGEQGRGFAVVAAEVRNLAQRSAGAAKEIKTLIKDSVAKVEEGSKLVNESGSTLQQIVAAVKKVSDIISEIAEASAEQSTGIDRVGQAIAQMDQAVQQNAALVEQASAASNSMDDQSRGLTKLMTMFQVGADDSTGEAAPVPRQVAARPPAARRPEPAVAPAAPKHTVASKPGRAKASLAVADAPDGTSGRWEEF